MRTRIQLLLPLLIVFCLIGASATAWGQLSSQRTGNWGSFFTWAPTKTGTINVTSGSTAVTGTGTSFTTEVAVNDTLFSSSGLSLGRVASITDNANIVLTANAAASYSGTYASIGKVPATTDNVTITSGTTVTVEASPKTCSNLTVESGAVLAGANLLPTSSLRYIRTYGSTITNNGTIGTPTDVVGFGMYGGAAQVLTITGSGTTYISRLQPQTSGQSVIFDANVQFDYAGGSGTGSTALYCANGDFNVTINAGKTVRMSRFAYTAVSTSSGSAAGNANFTFNIYGSFITGNLAHINLNNTAGKTSTLTVYNGGSIVMGDSSNIRADIAGPTYNIAINNGGSLTAGNTSMVSMASATTTVDGTVDFGGSITSTRSIGTTNVSSTGKLRLMDGTFPSGTVNLNTSSTVEYYGTTGLTMPASPSTYQNLTINTSGGAALGSSLTINGELALANGALSIGADTLTLNSTLYTTSGSLIGGSTSSIFFATTGASATVLPAVSLNNLQVDRSAGLTLGGNVSANTLALTNGAITTNANALSINSGGSVSRTSGYVIGTLQKNLPAGAGVPVTYELGTANGYAPASLTFNNVLSAGNLSCSIVSVGNPYQGSSGINLSKEFYGYWYFNGPAVFDSYTGTLNFNAADVIGGADPLNFIARAHNGSFWSPLTVGTKTATSTQISGTYADGGLIMLGEQTSATVTLTISAGPNGSISPSGAVVLASGTTQKVTITPLSGFHVDSVIVDGVKVDSTTSYTFVNPIADHTLRAVFRANAYQVTASAGANGAILPSGVVDVDSATTKVFTFTPNTGYHVDSVIVDGGKVDSTVSYTFVNVIANHTIRVTFAINQYPIVATSGANGTIAPPGTVNVNYGATQAFAMTPNAHYHVDSLFIDGVKVDSTTSYTFVNVTAAHTIRAVFALDQLAITATAATGGTITPSGTVNVGYGSNQTFTFSAIVHYQVDSVIVDGIKMDSTSSFTFFDVTAPHTIRITTAPIIMSIKSNGTGGGAWNTVGTWQGGIVPIFSDTVTIRATDSVVVGGNVACKTLNILAGGRLFLIATDTLAVTSTDSVSAISGTINNSGLITMSGKLQFNSGGKYQHARNAGSIPSSRWASGSTCEILGVTGNTPSNANQNFYNLTWNCPNQSANLNMGWNGNTIGGDVTVVSTGASNRTYLCAPTAGADSAHINTVTTTINGNINQSGGQFSSNGTGNGFTAIMINTMGNVNVTGGNFSVSRGSQGNTGTVTWNLFGNLSMTNCTTQNSNTVGGAKFVFAKAGTQSLVLGSGNTLTALPIEVKAGSTLNIDTCVLAGSGIFALDSGATIVTARANGLNGNLTNTGTITLNLYANFAYDGSAAQVTGALLPTNINSITVNNAAGVTLSDTVALADSLYLTAGKLTLNGNVLAAKGVVGSSNAKYVVTDAIGALRIKSVGATEVRFPVGTASAYAPLWITNAGTPDDMDVSVVSDTVSAKAGGRVKVKWNVAEKTAGGSNCTLKFGWMGSLEDATFAANRAGNAGIFKFGTDTAEAGTGVYAQQFASEPYSVSRAGIATFGTFAVGKFGPITSVDKIDQIPLVFSLSQNYPNPFNPTTTIEFTVAKTGQARLVIYNILGQKIVTLFDGEARSGVVNRVRFDATRLASGVYFARLESSDQKMMRRLMLLK